MDTDLITSLSSTVEEACAGESNIFGYGIWTHHITQVVANVCELVPRFDADEEIVVLSALLHDYASIKDESLYENHHIHSPREAEQLLEQHDYPQERIDQVKQCIANHRGSVDSETDTPEAACLANADAMAHIQQAHSLLYLAYVEHEMEIDNGAEWVRAKLERSWEKMDPIARELVASEYETTERFSMSMVRTNEVYSVISTAVPIRELLFVLFESDNGQIEDLSIAFRPVFSRRDSRNVPAVILSYEIEIVEPGNHPAVATTIIRKEQRHLTRSFTGRFVTIDRDDVIMYQVLGGIEALDPTPSLFDLLVRCR